MNVCLDAKYGSVIIDLKSDEVEMAIHYPGQTTIRVSATAARDLAEYILSILQDADEAWMESRREEG